MFQVILGKKVLSALSRLTATEQTRILQKIQAILTVNPYPHGHNPLRLTGIAGYRLRVGDYRVLYTIEKKVVVIRVLAHRKEVYRK